MPAEISCGELREAYEEAVKEARVLGGAFKRAGEGIRQRGYLEPQDLVFIYSWKAPAEPRARGMAVGYAFEAMERHGFDGIKKITEEAIELARASKAKESVEKLRELHGADVRVASAILTAYDPNRFAVVDWKAWEALCGEEKQNFKSEDYARYLQDVRS